MKTKVKITKNSNDFNYIQGDIGYIDGYVTDGNYVVSAIVFLDKNNKAVIVPVGRLESIGFLFN